jgi:hypothetical protein
MPINNIMSNFDPSKQKVYLLYLQFLGGYIYLLQYIFPDATTRSPHGVKEDSPT